MATGQVQRVLRVLETYPARRGSGGGSGVVVQVFGHVDWRESVRPPGGASLAAPSLDNSGAQIISATAALGVPPLLLLLHRLPSRI